MPAVRVEEARLVKPCAMTKWQLAQFSALVRPGSTSERDVAAHSGCLSCSRPIVHGNPQPSFAGTSGPCCLVPTLRSRCRLKKVEIEVTDF